ncbi:MAG: CoB--CoM heterodisulfide reductase iron-sulfur subunit B family protein [Anaerolineales bacterium]|nr:CoB--CoM heterodisulfide reductase iron-sulfur subunit B family protein [Anaerolineales bacterium]
MKEFAYFPGCSLEKMASSYHMSAMETTKKLGIKLKEIEDWNCCGATTYFYIDELLAYTLCARNLAIAEKTGLDVVAPCSACYKNMFFTAAHLKKDADLAEHINFALEEDDLHFNGNVNVKHLIEVFAQDIGPDELKSKVTKPLEGIRIAPYYGCQIIRPQKEKEDVEQPQFFEDMLSAIGATPVNYPLKMRCCSASLIISSRTAALTMVRNLLQSAVDAQATVIATACPMCQVNLEVYQQQVNLEFGTNFSVPVLYFTQLVGLALGIPQKKLGIGKEFVTMAPSLLKVGQK